MNPKLFLSIIKCLSLIVALVVIANNTVSAQSVYGPGGVQVAKPLGQTGSSYQAGGSSFSLKTPSTDTGLPRIVGKEVTTPSTGGSSGGGGGFPNDIFSSLTQSFCLSKNGARIGAGCTGLGAGPKFLGGAFKDEVVDQTSCAILSIPQGSFGAMAMVIAGVIAVCGAMLGSYRMALNTILVGGGAWAIMPLVTLFWGEIC